MLTCVLSDRSFAVGVVIRTRSLPSENFTAQNEFCTTRVPRRGIAFRTWCPSDGFSRTISRDTREGCAGIVWRGRWQRNRRVSQDRCEKRVPPYGCIAAAAYERIPRHDRRRRPMMIVLLERACAVTVQFEFFNGTDSRTGPSDTVLTCTAHSYNYPSPKVISQSLTRTCDDVHFHIIIIIIAHDR